MTGHPLHNDTDDADERRRWWLWLWLPILAVLLAGLLVAIERLNGCDDTTCGATTGGNTAPIAGPSHGSARSNGAADAAASSLEVSGRISGALAPGITRPAVISITNTGATSALITSARVSVGDASAACPAAQTIRVTHYSAQMPGVRRYDVTPGSAVEIPITISMLDLPRNQNACKSAHFPLTFYATARQG